MASANNNKLATRIAVAVILTLAVGAGVMHVVSGLGYVTTDDAYVDGRVHAMAPKISGTVKKVHVTDNQAVHKGDVLVEIDPADYEVRLKQAEAELAAQQARVLQAQAGLKTAEVSLGVQKAAFNQAGLDRARAHRLFNQGVLPKEKVEKADTAFDLAKAQLEAAQETIGQAKASTRLEEAQVATRQSLVESARLNLGYTRITAPADGYVTRKSVEEGNMLQPGQSMMAVVALDDVWVSANFKETQLERVKPGQRAEIRVDMYPGKVFHGKVDSLMAGTGAAFSLFPPENAMGNYVKVVQRIPIKIVLERAEDPEHVLRVGMSVIAKVNIREE